MDRTAVIRLLPMFRANVILYSMRITYFIRN
eukprot:UN15233